MGTACVGATAGAVMGDGARLTWPGAAPASGRPQGDASRCCGRSAAGRTNSNCAPDIAGRSAPRPAGAPCTVAPSGAVGARYAEAQQPRPAELTRERAAATPRATLARPVAPGEALPQLTAQVAPAKPTGAAPAPSVPGAPVTSGLAPAYGATPAPAECQSAPPMTGSPAAVQAAPVAQGAAVASAPDISELLAQAPERYRRGAADGEQAEPAATGRDGNVGELIARARAASRQKGVVNTPDVVTGAEGRMESRQPREVDTGRTSAQRTVEPM